MNPIDKGILGLFVLFLLLIFNVPIGFAMLIVGFCGTLSLIGLTATAHAVSEATYGIVSNYDYAVLPLFVFMSSICFFAGFGERLFKFTNVLLGHMKGGLAMATIGACALFAAASASTIATALTMGKVAIPEMKRYQYSEVLACACSAVGGVLGVLIPPSGIMIIYGIITGESIGKLFIAGIVPGILLTLTFCVVIRVWTSLKPTIAPERALPSSFHEKIKAFTECGEMLVLIAFLMVSIALGWITPTEAGGIGAFGAMLLSLFRRLLTIKKIKDAIIDTLKTTGMVFTLILGAFVLNTFLTLTTLPMELANYVSGMKLSPLMVMGAIVIMYIVLGCVIDSLSMLLLTLPIIFPLVKAIGFDPIWFGIIVVLVFEMAVLTPPVGMNVYVISALAEDAPMEQIFKAVIPFLAAILFMIVLLFVVPGTALFLTERM